MRILLSAIPFDNGKSGISVYIREVVKALKQQGHELTLIVEDDGAKEFEGFDLIRITCFKLFKEAFKSGITCSEYNELNVIL